MRRFLLLLFAAHFFAACHTLKPQRGGASVATLGGASGTTTVSNTAPENPQTPSTTVVEKTITREFIARETLGAQPASNAAGLQNPTGYVTGAEAAPTAPASPVLSSAPQLLRETVSERATTQLGSAQKDTARELGVKLANMRGVMWVGVALLIGGPIVGIKMGWPTNGAIAGAAGLLLIILSQVIPGHSAWFGLGLLLLIPLVCFVYYRARHDAANPSAS